MRTLQTILAALALSATASAFAEAPYPAEQPFVSTLSRAQVMQEVAEAQAQGLLVQGDSAYPAMVTPGAPAQKPMIAQHSEKKDAGDAIYAGA